MESRESPPVSSPERIAVSSSPDETERTEQLTARRELRKIIREDSNWSLRSISITALTGISVAVISTQLTGLVNSVVLIAIMAFITASVSEMYRVFIALTSFGARKAAAQAARVLPLTATEQKAVAQVEESPVTEALEVVKSAYQLSDEQEARHPGLLRRVSYRLKNYGKANPFLWLVVLFLGIAITTLGVTYLVTDGQPPRIIQRTVVATEEISESDRAAIVAEAKEQAIAELQAQQDRTQPSNDASALDGMGSKLSELERELNRIQSSEDQAAPAPQPTPLTDSQLLDRIAALERERTELTAKIQELEARIAQAESSSSDQNSSNAETTAPPGR